MFREEYGLFFWMENILLLKENQIPLFLRLVVYWLVAEAPKGNA